MRGVILAALVAGGLGALSAAPAQALGPVPMDAGASEALVTPVASAARQRRLYMMQSIQQQQARDIRRRQYYGYGGGYRGGYGGGYGPPRGYYGPPRGGYYGY